MRGLVRVGAAVPSLALGNVKENMKRHLAMMREAKEKHVSIVTFPELSLTGYTCGDLFFQRRLLDDVTDALLALKDEMPEEILAVVGAPLEIEGALYNCAVVLHKGEIISAVPKTFLPNNGEFYEKRWFQSGDARRDASVAIPKLKTDVCRQAIFETEDSVRFGIELCEDLWVPAPPSARLCMGGALMLVNPSASNELVTKHRYRCELIAQQSARCLCGYLYAGAGYGESTTDLVFSGYAGVYENGRLLAENERFARQSSFAVADVDVERLRFKRRQSRTFAEDAPQSLRTVRFELPAHADERLLRAVSPLPFVPAGAERDARTEEILLIQTTALLTRMERVNTRRAVLGVSGGLDSTLTLLAAAYAFRRAGYPMEGLVGITMPGMGTGSRTLQNALRLMALIGCTTRTIPIVKAVEQHFEDIGQDPEMHDVAYENSQARERTQIIMDVANQIGGLALGTGDLSELALGWCTYNGDQMSMYNMSASVPKTLIRHLVRYAGAKLGGEIAPVVEDILDTPISPELIPSKAGELTQRTEDTLGAYALHDFFLYHMMDSGASPLKLYPLAKAAFDGQYADDAILAALRTFVRRFFTQQFKRSAMPDGPKVGSVSLSPRGDWRMPSDAQSILWMQEVEQLERQHP